MTWNALLQFSYVNLEGDHLRASCISNEAQNSSPPLPTPIIHQSLGESYVLELELVMLTGEFQKFQKVIFPGCAAPADLLFHHYLAIAKFSNMNLTKLWEAVEDRRAWRALVNGVTKSQIRLND